MILIYHVNCAEDALLIKNIRITDIAAIKPDVVVKSLVVCDNAWINKLQKKDGGYAYWFGNGETSVLPSDYGFTVTNTIN